MRACRLGLVDTCSRLLVEPQERRFAAAILGDASCLLVPLGDKQGGGGILLRSPACSDACFLRLQSRDLENPSSLQFGQFGSNWKTLLLLASSSKGGTCTDIRAWNLCNDDDEAVKQIGVLPVPRGKSATAMVARLGIPHGDVPVHMDASVNVLVVYSPSVGKVWIMAAKEAQDSSRLLLITCAVLDCAPRLVHTLHLSPQHLFLGEKGGIRVVPLRPLIKGKKGDVKLSNTAVVHPEEQLLKNGLVNNKNGFVSNHKAQDDQKEHSLVPKLHDVFAYAPLGDDNNNNDVVAIVALSVRAFLVLDSSGKIHCLSLKRLPAPRRPQGKDSSCLMQLDVKPVEIPFPVSIFTVLPSLGAPPRKMWVSDGKNSVHIFSIPEEMAFDHQGYCVRPTVLQAVFMGAQIASLVAISSETVLAITQGTLVAYVKAGS